MLGDAVWIVVDTTGRAVRRFVGDLTAALLYAAERHGKLLGPFTARRAAQIMEELAKKVYGAKDGDR